MTLPGIWNRLWVNQLTVSPIMSLFVNCEYVFLCITEWFNRSALARLSLSLWPAVPPTHCFSTSPLLSFPLFNAALCKTNNLGGWEPFFNFASRAHFKTGIFNSPSFALFEL